MIIWMDGPDHYGTNPALLIGPYAENGSTHLLANSGPGGVGTVFSFGDIQGSSLRKVLPGQRFGVGVGMRFKFPVLNPQTLYSLRDMFAVELGRLEMLSTGALRYRRSRDGVYLMQTDPVIVANAWQHVELYVGISDVSGQLRVGVDSITIFSSDDIKTEITPPVTDPPTPLLGCAQMVFPLFGVTGRDLYIWDSLGAINNAGMQGDRQIILSMPTADGTDNDWVPSAGTHGYSLINEIPPVDTDYITANAANLKSSFQVADIDTDITSISACMVVSRMKKSDAGIGTVKLGVISSADEAQGAEMAVSTQFTYYSTILEKDPHTNLKWTPGGVNAAEISIQRVE